MIAAIYARFELRNAVDARNVRRLQTFLALFDIEFHFFAFVQRTITTVRILNRGKVNEQVLFATVRGNETIALAVVEPLDGALLFGHFCGASFLKCHVAEIGGKKNAPCCISRQQSVPYTFLLPSRARKIIGRLEFSSSGVRLVRDFGVRRGERDRGKAAASGIDLGVTLFDGSHKSMAKHEMYVLDMLVRV